MKTKTLLTEEEQETIRAYCQKIVDVGERNTPLHLIATEIMYTAIASLAKIGDDTSKILDIISWWKQPKEM